MPEGTCAKCGAAGEVVPWIGFLDSINAIRMSGSHPRWCRLCIAKAQLEHARTESVRLTEWIPELEAKIAELEATP